MGPASLVPGRCRADIDIPVARCVGTQKLTDQRRHGDGTGQVGDRGHHDAGLPGIGEASTRLAKAEMGGEVRRQPWQGGGRSQRGTGLGGLGGEDLLGEVGEQWTIGSIRAVIRHSDEPRPGRRRRWRPPNRRFAGAACRRVPSAERGHRAEQFGGLLGREGQLCSVDLSAQPVDEQPAGGERQRAPRGQDDVQMVGRVTNECGGQFGRRPGRCRGRGHRRR